MNSIILLLEWNLSLHKHAMMDSYRSDNLSVVLVLLHGVDFLISLMSTLHVLPLKVTILLWPNNATNSWWNLLRKYIREKQWLDTLRILINFKQFINPNLLQRLLMISLTLIMSKKLLKSSAQFAFLKQLRLWVKLKVLRNRLLTKSWL